MGKSSAPSVPSAADTSAAQTGSNVATAVANAALNNVNQITPTGTNVFNQTGSSNVDGYTIPNYTEKTTLTPAGQNILTGEQNVAQTVLPAANSLAAQAGQSAQTPLNFNTADSGILNSTPQQLDTKAADAVYNQQASYLNPQWDQQQQQTEDQLSRQGIPVGSQAYDNAMTQLDNARTQAYQSAQDSATAQGAQSASNLFNMGLQGQQQNISQQQLAESQPISLLQSLLGTAPTTGTSMPSATPTSSSAISPTNVVGAQQTANNAALSEYQSQLQQQNSTFGALGSLGASLLGAGSGSVGASLLSFL